MPGLKLNSLSELEVATTYDHIEEEINDIIDIDPHSSPTVTFKVHELMHDKIVILRGNKENKRSNSIKMFFFWRYP